MTQKRRIQKAKSDLECRIRRINQILFFGHLNRFFNETFKKQFFYEEVKNN